MINTNCLNQIHPVGHCDLSLSTRSWSWELLVGFWLSFVFDFSTSSSCTDTVFLPISFFSQFKLLNWFSLKTLYPMKAGWEVKDSWHCCSISRVTRNPWTPICTYKKVRFWDAISVEFFLRWSNMHAAHVLIV